jgi:predicted amidohydrolase
LHAALKECSQVVQSSGARLLVLPHLVMHDLKAQDFDPAKAAVLDVQALEAVKASARKSSCWLVFSSIKVHAQLSTTYHLCTDLIDPTGAIFASQIQIHVPEILRTWVSAGDQFKVFQTPIGRIGLLGGADAQVLESFRVLTYLGAQVVCVSGAIEDDKEVDLGLRERVAENRIHIVFASRSDALCAQGSVIVQASAYPSEPHWRVRFPDVLCIKPLDTQLSASLDLLATNDKTVAPLGCDLLLSPRYDQYQRLIEP